MGSSIPIRLTVALSTGFVVYVAVGTVLLMLGPRSPGMLIPYQVLAGLAVGMLAGFQVFRRVSLSS